jgi:endonuclease/exonuclease/phosphatase family metal-dependent hydrolase
VPDSGTPDAGGDSGPPPMNEVLRIATFNAGLLDTVGWVPERRPLVNDAIAELAADVLCVQEVWLDEDWDALVEANDGVRDHVERIEPLPGVPGLCTPEEFQPLRACSELMCPDAGPSDLSTCTISMCEPEVLALSGACGACLIDNGATGDLDMIEAACLGSGGGSDGPVAPEDRSYFLGGAFGIGLLSKLPLNDVDTIVLDSSTSRRGIIYASIDVPELGEIGLFCTHLSAVLNGVRYEGSFDDWEGENTAHVAALLEWVDEKTDDGDKVVVLGDLNTGPAVSSKDIVAEVPESYAQLPEADYEDPFLDGPNADCTFCSSNPLVHEEDTGVGGLIDHIMVRGFDTEITADRILDGLLPVESDADSGVPDELPLSDHYGVEAIFFE